VSDDHQDEDIRPPKPEHERRLRAARRRAAHEFVSDSDADAIVHAYLWPYLDGRRLKAEQEKAAGDDGDGGGES
jgi:hypothetical protein